ncbi:MAG: hypothetical protein U1E87_08300 [Alphaproteobacteria bacterium]
MKCASSSRLRRTFYVRSGDLVYRIICTAGDLISVPKGTKHWADTSERPNMTVVDSSAIPTAGKRASPATRSPSASRRMNPKRHETRSAPCRPPAAGTHNHNGLGSSRGACGYGCLSRARPGKFGAASRPG